MTPFQALIAAWLSGERNPAPVSELVGFRLVALDGGVAKVELDADGRHHNPMGIVHGGILCDLADAAMGVAVAAALEEGETFATLQLSATYLRAVRDGRLVASGRLVHRGRNAAHAEAEVTDAEGRIVARCTSSCLVSRG
jgi:uncharacterized protein (TIGR00369 family)